MRCIAASQLQSPFNKGSSEVIILLTAVAIKIHRNVFILGYVVLCEIVQLLC